MKIASRGLVTVAFAVALFASLPTNVSPQAESRKQDQKSAILSPEELFKRLSPSVFVVEVFDDASSLVTTGSAVAIAPDQVVTNKQSMRAGASALKRLSRFNYCFVASVNTLNYTR